MPQPIDHYTQRPSLTKAVWEKFRQPNMGQDSLAVLTGLHGLGGIGKTTLAKHAINYPEKKYSFRGWFGAETKNLLLADYLGLGEQQNLFTQDNISVNRKVLLVKQWLESQSNALLVYDNVDDMEVLRDYLPKKGDIIITSRNPNIPGAIEIDVMDEKEALNLLDNLMPKSIKKQGDYNKDIKILASTLEYLPLAIAQAGAYIRENMLSIQDYLILYATEQNILLSDETMPSMDDHKPAYISWDLAIKKIEIEIDGKQAIELLNVISCCYPEHIPKKLLAQYLYNNTDNTSMVRLNKILTLLRKYSLIKTSSDNISVHRLVHSWLGSKLHKNASNFTLYEKLCKALNVITPKLSEDQNEDGHVINTLYPHINKILKTDLVENQNVLLEKAELFNKLGLYNQYNLYQVNKALVYYDSAEEIYNKLKIGDVNLAKVLMNQGWCYFMKRNLEKALSKFDQVLKLLDRSVPREMQANALRGKGLVHDQQKWIDPREDSLKFHMEAYEIYKKLYSGKDHRLLATAMHNIGWYYKDRYKEDQGNNYDPDIVFEWFNKSLAMRRRLFKGSMHPDIASSLNSIGDLYRKLGGNKNLQLALDYQLQALKTREYLSGGRLNHYMIGSYSRLGETY
ncbi:MAG: NB-ARC domain-containing protein [Rickettsiaceae bacterium]|nr:NB-ARC domain-containing protein [Rickettsiaceae bacterium]